MVYSRRRGVRNTAFRTRVVREVYDESEARLLLREDPVGLPVITDLRYMTSANRAHHAMHLAAYRRARWRNVWDVHSVIEWGGGYGDMARLIRRMNEGVTYTIIDLPEISALQYVYLATLEGEDALNVIVPERGFIQNGRINLVSVYDLPRIVRQLKAGSFISTWAITESPAESQEAVADSRFFGAERILIASVANENNAIDSYVERFALQRVAIGDDARVGSGNEYWFL